MPKPPFETFWDRAYAAGDHLDHWEPPEVPAETRAMVADGLVGPGTVVLDLGCGTGFELVYLARRGARAIGVDSSRRAVELARERALRAGVEVELHRASVHALPLADATVDVVLDRGCLHGIEPEDRASYAAQVARVLCAGGIYLVRGARETDEEAGLFAVDDEELDRLFPAPAYARGPLEPLTLGARAGDLPGALCRVHKRTG